MSGKKIYEEKQRHGTVEFPVGLHKMEYPEGTDVIFYLHWHKEFELLVLTKGEIVFTIEDREYVLHTGDTVFINSNLLHSAKTVDKKACSFYAIVFSYEALEDDLHSAFAKKYIRPLLHGKYSFREFLPLEKDWHGELLSLLAEISRCPEHDLAKHELLVKSRLYCVWYLMYEHGQKIRKDQLEESEISERLIPVIAYIKENYAFEVSLADLAKLIPMSEGQFCRVFKQQMKVSPMQYLLRYRILQSCRLLQDTEKKIGEIANLTGFNNISYFNKVFLKTIGCTPKEYRASVNY